MYGYPVWHSSHESCLAPLNHCNLLRLRFGISQLDWRVFPGFSGSSDSGNLLNRNLHKKDGDIYLPPPAKFSLSFFFFTGTVWSWGDGDYGKLGHGGSDGTKTPKIIDTLQSLGVVRVFCGSQFSVALTRDGQVLTWCVQLYDCQF